MNWALNFIPFPLAEAAAPTDVAGLSDWELISQYPAVTRAAAVLRLLGFACGLYLWWRYVSARRDPAFKISTAPACRQGLPLAISALFAAMLGDALVFAALSGTELTLSAPTLAGIIVTRLTILVATIVYLRHASYSWPANPARCGRALWVGSIFYLAVVPPVEMLVLLTTALCRAAGITLTAQPITEQLIHSFSPTVVWFIVILAVVVAPLFEELMFRGLAYPALKRRWGTAPALILVSALFALTHLHLPSVAPLFALGLGLGLAYEVSGSLLAPIAMHALFNAVNVGMLLYVRWHA